MSDHLTILQGDCLERLRELPECSVHCCVTSPPYWGLRNYGVAGQIGLEKTPAEYVGKMVEVFTEVRRVLRDDGTCWVNLGDTYAMDSKWGGKCGWRHSPAEASGAGAYRRRRTSGLKPKDMVGIPWRVAFALQEDGWYLRSDIIWHKPNPMPESVTDRPTKSHEYLFLLSKSERYHYDAEAIKEQAVGPAGGNVKPSRSFEHDPVKHRTKAGLADCQARAREAGGFQNKNKRTVWTVPTSPFKSSHFATFPPGLIKPCILAGCPVGGTVLDPFGGSGTTGMVALELGRKAILIEMNPDYIELAKARCNVTPGLALI